MYTGQGPAELALQLTKCLLFGLSDKKPRVMSKTCFMCLTTSGAVKPRHQWLLFLLDFDILWGGRYFQGLSASHSLDD